MSLGSKVYSIQSTCCHEFRNHRNGQCTNDNMSTNTKHGREGVNYKDKMVLKGISKNSRRHLTFEDYFQCLRSQNIVRSEDHRIQSRNQKITSSIVHKIALTSFCDKRYILDCGIHSVPYGASLENSSCYESECMNLQKQI